ncbi:MAG TPA: type II toxin-antitoxin system Phd/YefM family antitoxin [Candidatus Dormibacteraeota bacterium]|nr:type II toxin-antitoxin system Phd/YefM family antitoxin [Candidatus Dormibacteraeota bacterium]
MTSGPRWQLQEAKARFSELFERALREAPQVVTRRGKDAVVVISESAYLGLCAPRESLLSFLLHSPLVRSELDSGHAEDAYVPRVDFNDDDSAR